MGRKAPRKRLAYEVISAFTGVCDAHDTHHGCRCTRTFLGAPPTPRFGVSEATMQNPGRKNAPRERRSVVMSAAKKPTRAEEALPAAEQRRLAPALRQAHARLPPWPPCHTKTSPPTPTLPRTAHSYPP